jgi:hypothetical protein
MEKAVENTGEAAAPHCVIMKVSFRLAEYVMYPKT